MQTYSHHWRNCFRLLPAVILVSAVASLGIAPAPSAAADPTDTDPVKTDPKPEDFGGRWVGKWDDRFKVEFSIIRNTKAEGLIVLYEWEERPGQPLRSRLSGGVIDGNKLIAGQQVLEITLSAKDPKKATAVGLFAKTRSANLTRQADEKEAVKYMDEKVGKD
jgi:hypothetical protein